MAAGTKVGATVSALFHSPCALFYALGCITLEEGLTFTLFNLRPRGGGLVGRGATQLRPV